MSLPRVDNCCFFISLKTGCLIIGFLSMTMSVLELFLLTMSVTLKPVSLSSSRVAVYVTHGAVTCLTLLFAILVVIATIKRIPALTLPWTILAGMQSVLHLLLCSIIFTSLLQTDRDLWDVALAVYFTLRSVFKLYFLVVVHSHHKELMERRAEERPPELNFFLTPHGDDSNRTRELEAFKNILRIGRDAQSRRIWQ